jgi:hypothetical protein
MRHQIAEVDEQSIARILRDVSREASDDPSTHFLIGAHHLCSSSGSREEGNHTGLPLLPQNRFLYTVLLKADC